MGCEKAVQNAMRVTGFSGREYLEALYHAARDTDVEGEALEVGCFMGRSTAAICAGLRDRNLGEKLTVIDGFMAPEEDVRLGEVMAAIYKPALRFKAWMEDVGIDNFVLIEADSQKSETWDKAPARIRFAHIDGDHSYEGCRFDLERVMERAVNGTVVVVDDYHQLKWEWGVYRAVNEVLLPRARSHRLLHGNEQILVEVAA